MTMTDERLAERRSGIGGSDAAAVLGLNPYKTAYQLWLEKTGQVEPEDISGLDRVRFGIKLEQIVADEYAERTGRTVHRVNTTLRHAEHPFMLANIDRRVVGERRGLECKTVDKDVAKFNPEWGEGGDAVPTSYLLQCQHYLAVTGWDAWDLAALVGGNEFRLYTIERDESLIAMMEEAEAAFWACVESKTEPPIRTLAEAKERFPNSVERAVQVNAEVAGYVTTLAQYRRDIKALEKSADDLQALICAAMGDADTLLDGERTLATWRSTKPGTRLDTEALKSAHPDLVAQFTRETAPSRRFLLKG